MNPMNVAGMNPGAGGPVGGVPMINNGSTAPRNDGNMNNPEIMINNLNTYIYDYFLKRGYHDCARALVQDESIKLNTDSNTSPGNRRDSEMNGIDGDPMMTDGKDGEKIKIPDGLPRPSLPSESQQSSFLLDWFSLFWDFFWAQRKKGNSNDVRQYLQHTQNLMRMREQQHNQLLRQQPLMPGQMGPLNMRGRNGMVPPNLQKTVLQNNTSGLSQHQIAQFQKTQQMQLMQQMQRDQPEVDMNGHRPQSPASADNAPSPSKRPRIEGGPANGQQLAPNGRGQGQGMPGQPTPQQLLMQNGMAQRGMTPAQFQQFQQGQAAQQKSMQVYAQNLALHHSRSALNSQGMPNGGMMNPGVMSNQADLVPMPDGQGMYPMGPEYYGSNGQMPQVRPGMATPGGQHGNHALQDYQMQLMLLEQQNKRRLMMARQEQDSMARTDGQPPMPGQQGLPPGTSPQGSRAGASPNPSEQMKRGTPKMPQSGLPGSPSAADAMSQNRGSPGSMNLNGGQMPPDMAAPFFPGPNMRPPSSNPAFTGPQMGQPLPANAANRMPSGQWQPGQQPIPPQHSPANQPQAGTPQERGAMPPPQAPPAAGANAGRTPASPQTTGNAPPTPQQANKPAPKGKKDGKDTRKRPTKKNSAAANAASAATPSTETADANQTPSTPVTPQHPNSFNKAGANATTTAPQPTSAPAPQQLVQPPPDQTQQPFNDLSIPDPSAFDLDFRALDDPNLLENFDFDTFLNTDADTTTFGFDPNISYPDGVETGAGDPM
ncbi:hypothetical protein NUU61_005649 [Penicillium alfredii]|uniref:LisH domain-containing protein n=1 Tax=Penicillium alfredii TaxID=1506179 RepID=A0A9W9F9W6_9EURO|nr:uncharacterized protein NUU61_005649 [Penicillium alfredii]KAJ5096293.1 hypothetical protein NUU61_005649 [Penicillium alfredii]